MTGWSLMECLTLLHQPNRNKLNNELRRYKYNCITPRVCIIKVKGGHSLCEAYVKGGHSLCEAYVKGGHSLCEAYVKGGHSLCEGRS